MRARIIKYIVLFFALTFAVATSGCSKKRTAIYTSEDAPFERKLDLISGQYPKKIIACFSKNEFPLADVQLFETVDSVRSEQKLHLSPALPETLDILVIIEDVSGSMQSRLAKADAAVGNIAAQMHDCLIALIRIGREAKVSVKPLWHTEFTKLKIDSLYYPSPKGTSLADGLSHAHALIGDKRGAIVLITDSNLELSEHFLRQLHLAENSHSPILVVSLDGADSEYLQRLAHVSGGYFATTTGDAARAILAGMRAEYVPTHADTFGATHWVELIAKNKKRSAFYVEPGSPQIIEPNIVVINTEPQVVFADTQRTPAPSLPSFLVPFYDAGNDSIYADAFAILEKAAVTFDTFTNILDSMELIITGYTCDIGSDSFNISLAHRRAQNVADFLAQHMNKKLRFAIIALGKKNPIVPNTTDAARSLNRRVELKFADSTEANARWHP